MDLVEQGASQGVEIVKIPDIPKLCDSFQGDKGKVDIGDCSLYLESEPGTGKHPLVLLHGGPGGTHHDFHPHFSHATSSFQSVNYYDQRGCGQSDYVPGSGYSIGQAADDLEALRIKKGFEKMVVLGHSYGGILAQKYGLKYPKSLAGLILVTSGLGYPHEQIDSSLYQRGYARMTKEEMLTLQAIHEKHWRGEIDLPTLIYNIQKHGDWKRQLSAAPTPEQMAYAALFEWQHDPVYAKSINREMSGLDLQRKFSDFQVPTLIIEGDDPTWAENKPQEIKDNHPNAQLVILPGADHIPFRSNSDEFFRKIGDFVQTLA